MFVSFVRRKVGQTGRIFHGIEFLAQVAEDGLDTSHWLRSSIVSETVRILSTSSSVLVAVLSFPMVVIVLCTSHRVVSKHYSTYLGR